MASCVDCFIFIIISMKSVVARNINKPSLLLTERLRAFNFAFVMMELIAFILIAQTKREAQPKTGPVEVTYTEIEDMCELTLTA